MEKKVNLKEKLESFNDTWSPKVVGELNNQYVKVVKLQGEYVWHFHECEDELFMVIDGEMKLHFRDGTVTLKEGEFCVVPHGVEHKPEASDLCQVLLFEPATTRNTGNVSNDVTIEPDDLEKI